tara:strand:- start:871 stop:1755 length:885 start_codon:yes stop_codon:yes gene_type:complete
MDDSLFHEFYLINKNNLKLNILEGEYLNSPKAIVINIHGIGSHFQPIINETCFDNFYNRDKLFCKYAIKSYALEFQGHGKSEGTKCLITDFNNLVEDIRVLIEYLNQRYPVQKKFIIAESMGGNAAIRYCVKYNDIGGLILLSPMCGIHDEIIPNYCLRNILLPLSHLFPNLPLIAGHQSEMSVHNKNYNEMKKQCKYNYHGYIKLATGRECLNASLTFSKVISKFTTPVIAFHDIDDKITDPYITELFIKNCQSSDKKFVAIKNSHHCLLLSNDKKSNNPLDIINQIINWIIR